MLTTYVVTAIVFDMDDTSIHEQQNIHHILSHIIFCPKRRKKVFVSEVADRLKQSIHEVANEHAWQITTLAIQPDHVHLFIQSNPSTRPDDSARFIKGRSSHDLRGAFSHLLTLPSLWTRSTFSSTAGSVSQETIQNSIERQRKT